MSVQVKIPPGLGAVHNFIMNHYETDILNYLDDLDLGEPPAFTGNLGQGAIAREERERASVFWDDIATRMWNSYQQFLRDHPEVLEEEFNPEEE